MKKRKGLKVLIMGLPTSGKTTLAKALYEELTAQKFFVCHYNADELRGSINHKLGFSDEDRNHQAFTMGWLADRVCDEGGVAICDFVCPTLDQRALFDRSSRDSFIVFVDRVKESPYDDTNEIFQPPQFFDHRVEEGTTVRYNVVRIIRELARQRRLISENMR